jgi:hypothetical protein
VNRGTSWGPRAIARRSRRGKPFDPWLDLEWEEDALAQQLVAEEPDGMTLDAIGEHLDLTRERVRQIEQEALKKLRSPELGNDVVEFDGWSFAVLECLDCCSPFIRLNGRQELCESCSARRRASTPKGRRRDHAWSPSSSMERSRKKLADARLAAASIRKAQRRDVDAPSAPPVRVRIGEDGIRIRVRLPCSMMSVEVESRW